MGFKTDLFKLTILFSLLVLSTINTARADSIIKPDSQAWDGFFSQHYLLTLITNVERYQSGQGNPKLYESLTLQLTAFRARFNALLLPESRLSSEQKQRLKQQWQQTARALSACLVTVKQGGFIEQEVSYQYQEGMQVLWRELHQALSIQAAPAKPEMELILLLQLANLRYLNPLWDLPPYEGQSIVTISDDLDAKIRSAASDQATLMEKWPVMSQALRNENHSMGFIVNRYSGDLVTLLLQRLEATRF